MYLHISSADELEDSYRDKNQGQRHTRTNNDEEEESNGPGTNVQLVLVSLLGRKIRTCSYEKDSLFQSLKNRNMRLSYCDREQEHTWEEVETWPRLWTFSSYCLDFNFLAVGIGVFFYNPNKVLETPTQIQPLWTGRMDRNINRTTKW